MTNLLLIVGASYCPEARALFRNMGVQPSVPLAKAYDDYFNGLRAAGILSVADEIYYLRAHTAQASLLNLMNPAQTMTASVGAGTLTFTPYQGWDTDGAASYLLGPANITTLAHFSQDNGSIWAKPNSNVQSGNDAGSVSSTNQAVNARNASDQFVTRGNSATTTTVASITEARALCGWDRNNSANYVQYRGGVSVGTPAAVSAALPAARFSIGRGGSSFSAKRQGAGGIGGSMTAAQWAALNTLNAAFDAVVATL